MNLMIRCILVIATFLPVAATTHTPANEPPPHPITMKVLAVSPQLWYCSRGTNYMDISLADAGVFKAAAPPLPVYDFCTFQVELSSHADEDLLVEKLSLGGLFVADAVELKSPTGETWSIRRTVLSEELATNFGIYLPARSTRVVFLRVENRVLLPWDDLKKELTVKDCPKSLHYEFQSKARLTFCTLTSNTPRSTLLIGSGDVEVLTDRAYSPSK